MHVARQDEHFLHDVLERFFFLAEILCPLRIVPDLRIL